VRRQWLLFSLLKERIMNSSVVAALATLSLAFVGEGAAKAQDRGHPPESNAALNHIYVYAVGGPLQGMWRHLGTGGGARFSPDNNWIAFQVRAGNVEGLEAGIYVLRDNGGERRRFVLH
jgi:hypothetical protein